VIDLAVVTQDPRFGGGARAQTEAFVRAARELGREPELMHPRFMPLVDSAAQLVESRRLAPAVRQARSAWVVAAAAPYGDAALRSARSYAAWIGTSLDEEWAARRPHLRPSRRLALELNAPLLRRLERRVLRGATRLYATSPSARAGLAVAAGLEPETIRILPIPVDTALYRPGPEEERQPTVVFVGRADDPRKNVRLLLQAWPQVRSHLPDTTLRLIGRPPAGPLPVGVEAAGEVASVADELRRASLFVLPSLQEGFGIVVAEALASGVPAVVTPCGGPEDLVRGSGGGTVLADFAASTLADAVVAALSDRVRLAEQGTSGRAYVVANHAPDRLRTELTVAFADLDDA
jgi:glycosyltransferase involved in cell wall biosynthesis